MKTQIIETFRALVKQHLQLEPGHGILSYNHHMRKLFHGIKARRNDDDAKQGGVINGSKIAIAACPALWFN